MLAKNALTTTDQVKTSADPEPLINTASDMIEAYCRREFHQAEVEEAYRGPDAEYLLLRRGPVIEVAELTIGGTELDADGYKIIEDSAMLYRAAGWYTRGYDIEITYTGGYILPKDQNGDDGPPLPNPVEYACILLCQQLDRMMHDNPDLQRKTRGGASVTYAERSDDIPAPVKALLGPWRWQDA